jgi:DNA polymerase-3 subunit delta
VAAPRQTTTPHAFLSQIHKSTPAPVYLFLGEEEFFLDSCLAALKKATLEDATEAFNYDLVFGEETDAQEILTFCEMLPVVATRRLVAVKHIDKLRARSLEALQSYVMDPVSSTCLALIGTKLDGRSKATQTLRKSAVVVECMPLSAREIPGWIRQYSATIKLRIDEPAIALMASASGQDLYTVKHELDKLATYLAPHTHATLADVQALLAGESSESVFEICNAIGRHDPASALLVMRTVIEAGEPPLRLLALLATQFRQLWKVKSLAQNAGGTRLTPDALAKTAGLSPFRVRSLLAQVNQFSTNDLRSAFASIAEADSRLKGFGGQAPKIILDALVMSLCRGATATQET